MSKKLTLYLTKGLPGSGKSTWAKSMIDKSKGQIVNVCKDDLRFMLRNGESSKATEKFVKEIRDFITKEAINKGCSVIWSDTNLHPSHELRAKELVKELDIRFEIKDFTEVPLETCIAQDLKRFNSVGEKVIMKMYNEFLKPQKVITHLEQNKELPKAIVCDLDGTLSLFKDIYNGLDENGKPIYLNLRNPYDASTSDKDLLNEPVANVIRQFFKAKYEIIFLSGRLETYREATEKFLKKAFEKDNLTNYHLFMRVDQDFRKDAVIKKELFMNNVHNKFFVEFILDDRKQVVDMWRNDLGLTVFQVAEGDF